ncbi:TPA: DUF952 domain-containing protein [Bacillus cytotoxicus]|uniref:DUF952 domain-containing protein n=1 Tax=Bacillus cereus group sp. BfR-BA-01360 TaxID=2920321 RepID=UPI001F56D6C0|nr:DUF952 domain-containing protein [Bacillus cereus group sp. BfR-BA-01360]HDR4570376.1 DUF952 domain-containing protein [Bacillus cytotoxicus]HDR4586188.1 DUF952 domain-containing protein [Bacillus cytotoxicus]
MSTITKVMKKEDWEAAQISGEIKEASLAEKHFRTEKELVLLLIDSTRVQAETKYEKSSNGQEYPHVYGTIHIDAVIDAIPFYREHGAFILPNSILLN